jgi:hypothetical protein
MREKAQIRVKVFDCLLQVITWNNVHAASSSLFDKKSVGFEEYRQIPLCHPHSK